MQFVPKKFEAPNNIEVGNVYLRMLSIDDLEEDYKAVMESAEELRGMFEEEQDWPSPDLTKRENLISLGWHEEEFRLNRSFTYAIEDLKTKEYLGCLYIYPSIKEKEADVYMWIRTSRFSTDFMSKLWGNIESWLQTSWPFKGINFPTKNLKKH